MIRARFTTLHKGLLLLLFLHLHPGVAGATSSSVSLQGREIAPEVRERLLEASASPAHEPWQRELMTRLAEGDRSGGASEALFAPELDGPSVTTADGAWLELLGTSPSARLNHTAIYDPPRGRMVVFGGFGGSYRNDSWELTQGSSWIELTPSGTPPAPRHGHTAIYDPARDRMLVFGGYDGASLYNDVWALSLSGSPVWNQLTASGTAPSPRAFHTTVYDPSGDRMVVFGGDDGNAFYNDVWALSLAGTPVWSALTPSGMPPSPRGYLKAIYDPVRDRMVTFGGYDFSFYSDVWALSLSGSPV